MRTTRSLRLALTAGLVACLLGAASCGDDSSGPSTSSGAGGGVTISKAWARSTAPGATNGAVYLTLRAKDADTLLTGAVAPTVARAVELHQTTADGTTMAGMSDAAMSMHPVAELALPKGKDVVLQPGGYHLMLVDLAKPLEVGSTLELTLRFAKTGEAVVPVPVRDAAP